ncbi:MULTISPECIES: aspartate/glutamate racemase family protein [Acinetobacter]|jgi:aspartate racemase|uniref:Aspartate/glutamate racemase family protein n=1 Tax=Acinetobacter pittii TaxID=48296 RepID=A0AAE9MC58_ACIPI|nr:MULTISPECIES: aspartate/glutamate racemase family protein [Acinetobacter calcoaceticus/baumannii complex]AZP28821.1 aspartate/glutamate racemase family protein [Acinetobacter pittii]EXE28415.1 aspartate racemase family protein [Acinetobacter sp. 907131]EXS17327.1 aspartate racemase family protein [Acinetobacter sp. 883425]MCE6001015.1 aspartate/glutamate racemase family protein [Acinetobacter pittii]MCE6628145.1 aspartate/glutamate racemase family protein [Acinetobacter pittii]
MKTIGLLGGMSWESTALYYQKINKMVHHKLGKLHSAKVIINSVDFEEIAALQAKGLWQEAGTYLAEQAQNLEKAGADCILVCTNTMHKVAAQIEDSITVPFLHIADATAKEILSQNIGKVALLGTAFTMEQDFYKARLQDHRIDVVIPNEEDRKTVHHIIYEELCLGVINPDSQQKYIAIVERLIAEGAQGIILGCTEICMLIGELKFSVPLFDTTTIHAKEAVSFSLNENKNFHSTNLNISAAISGNTV